MIRDYIVQDYQEAVALYNGPEELKKSLRASERAPAFIDNLVRELSKFPEIKRETIKSVTYDLTNVFLDAVKLKAEQMMLSDAAKNAMKAEHEEAKRMDKLANRLNAGEAVDIGEIENG